MSFELKTMKWLVLLAAWLPMLALASAEEPMGPQEAVRDTAQKVLGEVLERKEELKESPQEIYALVEKHVLPNFDFEYMARLVLGKHWKKASEEEQQGFIQAFRELLVRTYATALLNYSGQEVEYPDFKLEPGSDKVTVPTLVFASEGSQPIPINYSLHLVDGEWKVYDVKVEGISLVLNYRSSFSSLIRQHQISGLIERINQKNKSGK
jgi:phospholipid transport system substrate-binding protein